MLENYYFKVSFNFKVVRKNDLNIEHKVGVQPILSEIIRDLRKG